MSRNGFVRFVLGIVVLVAAAPLAHAGTCSNAQINQAYAALHMTPNGSGTSGDCNPNNYGAGSWTGMSDLETRIQHSHVCTQPWLGQIYFNLYNRNPSPAECSANYGSFSSYMDLTSKVQGYQSGTRSVSAQAAPSSPYHLDGSYNIVDNSNRVVARAGTYNLIGQDGSGMTAQQAANIITHDGGSMTAGRSAMGVGSKSVFVVNKR